MTKKMTKAEQVAKAVREAGGDINPDFLRLMGWRTRDIERAVAAGLLRWTRYGGVVET